MNATLSEHSMDSPRDSDACRKQHFFPLVVSWLGSVAVSGTLTIVFVSIARLIGALAGIPQQAVFGPMLLLWMATSLAIGYFWEGHASRSLGVRRKDRRPQFWKRRLRLTSMAAELKFLRIAIAIAISLPLLSSIIQAAVPRIDRNISEIGHYALLLFGWLAFMLGGFTVWICGSSTYRESQQRSLRSSLRFHHRGVALRSFISEWDNTSRDIYRTCRLSRRVATAHRTVFLTTLACFSMAACLVAMIDASHFFSECLALGSVIAIGVLWPTPKRLVSWSAEVLDPFCADQDEYEVY